MTVIDRDGWTSVKSYQITVDENASLSWYCFEGDEPGWTVVGWNTTAGATTGLAMNKTYTHNDVYAIWKANPYTVKFNANGGSGGQSRDVTATYGSAMPAISTTKPTRAGYAFQGWYDTSASTGGTQYYTADGKSARKWDKTSNTTLYARWTANAYSVTLDQQSGTGGTASVKPTYGSAMPAVTPPTRAGYAFNGYWDQRDGKGTQYYNWEGKSARNWDKAGNATLYAKWTKCGPRVHVHVPDKSIWRLFAFDGAYRVNEPAEYKWDSWRPDALFNSLRYYGGSVEVDSFATSDAGGGGRQFGYKFGVNAKIAGVTSAWVVAEQADGSRRAFALGATASWTDITGYAAVDVYLNRAVTYAVAWDANGGSVSPARTEGVLPWATATGAPLPTREGYQFTGWFTAKDGGDYVCGSGGSTGPIGGNVTYYAHWANKGPGVTMRAAKAPIYTYECYDSYDESARKGPMSKPSPYSPGMWVNDMRLSGGTLQLWGGFTWKEGAGWIDAGVTDQAKGVSSAWVVVEEQDGSKRGFHLGSSWTSVLPYKSVQVYLNGCVTYAITWDPDGGTVSPAKTEGVLPYASLEGIPLPTREGYAFRGWYAQRNGEGAQYADWQPAGVRRWDVAGDATLYARWTKRGPRVKVLVPGRSLWRLYGFDGAYRENEPYEYQVGEFFPAANFNSLRLWDGSVEVDGVREGDGRQFGYKFGLDPAIAGVESAWVVTGMADGSRQAFDLASSERWTDITDRPWVDVYLNGRGNSTVTWDANGGALAQPDGSLVPTAAFEGIRPFERTAAAPEPKRYGYAFDGWFTAPEGGSRALGAGDDLGQVSASATYYAHWTLITDVEVPIALDSVSFELGVPDGTVRVAGEDGGDGWAQGWLRSAMPVPVAVDSIRCDPVEGASASATGAEGFWADHAGYVDVLLFAGEREGGGDGGDAAGGGDGPDAEGSGGPGTEDGASGRSADVALEGDGDGHDGSGLEGDGLGGGVPDAADAAALAATGMAASAARADAPFGSSAPLPGAVQVSLAAGLDAATQPGGAIAGFTIPAATSADQEAVGSMGELPVAYGLSLARLFADPADGGAGVEVMDLLPDLAGPSYAALAPVLKVVFTVDAAKYA